MPDTCPECNEGKQSRVEIDLGCEEYPARALTHKIAVVK
jgi:hypothetical protein